MKNNLKSALDTALRDMDWHGEEDVLRAVRQQRNTRISFGHMPARTLVIAAVLMVLMLGTAIAWGINFSTRYQAQRQAADAIKSSYGLTDGMLDLFTAERETTAGGWIIRYTSNAMYGKELGVYTAEKKADGTVRTAWSHDNADQELVASGDLSSPAWGAKQLERILPLYHERMQNWKNVQNYEALTMEEKAALDAPLLEVPSSDLLINILPSDNDVTVEAALQIAQDAVKEKYGVSEETLSDYQISTAFHQYGSTERREYRIDLISVEGADAYVIYISSPEGKVAYCRWMVPEENRTLPEGDLCLYADAAQEYITTGAFELLNDDEKEEVAARFEAAGLSAFLPSDYIPHINQALSEDDAVRIATTAVENAFSLQGSWQELFQMRTLHTAYQEQQSWEIVWQPYNKNNWHWMDADKLGTYTVKLNTSTGSILACDWSLQGSDTTLYTETTFGEAMAYSAYTLPWINDLLDRAQLILNKYDPSVNLEDMTLEDRAAYDELFRNAGYSGKQYPHLLPNAKNIPQEEAATIALEAIKIAYDMDVDGLMRGEAFQEGFEQFESDNGLVPVWKIYYWNDTDVYVVLVNADHGEIEQIWHDDLSIGNG